MQAFGTGLFDDGDDKIRRNLMWVSVGVCLLSAASFDKPTFDIFGNSVKLSISPVVGWGLLTVLELYLLQRYRFDGNTRKAGRRLRLEFRAYLTGGIRRHLQRHLDQLCRESLKTQKFCWREPFEPQQPQPLFEFVGERLMVPIADLEATVMTVMPAGKDPWNGQASIPYAFRTINGGTSTCSGNAPHYRIGGFLIREWLSVRAAILATFNSKGGIDVIVPYLVWLAGFVSSLHALWELR